MIIGVVKEIKDKENRVGLIPSFIKILAKNGNEVIVESGAGFGSGFLDEEYLSAGAIISDTAKDVWDKADIIVKVKAPLQSEYDLIRENQILFIYLHLAADSELTNALIKSKSICIAYETVTDNFGKLPLLAPMSAIAGRMSILVASNLLQKQFGGSGLLPSGIPGVMPAEVIIIGGGNVGVNTAFIANGVGCNVVVLDNYSSSLQNIDNLFAGNVKTSYFNEINLLEFITRADIVIGAALVPGCLAPKLITRDMVNQMKKGSVIIDVSIDQGGCCETSKPTTLSNPYYEVDGVLHYCVTNMPGAYSRTSTISLNNATLTYIEKLALLGYEKALKEDRNLRNGLNIYKGVVTHTGVAISQNKQFVNPEKLFL